MDKPIFRGTATALITPFSSGRIDHEALGRLIEHQISGGIDALLINGTTGENATLELSEAKELISFAAERVGGRVPLIAGVGSNCTAKAAELSRWAHDAGADAVLAVTPYYNKASERGLIAHYSEIARAARLPVVLYNVPSRTGMRLSPKILSELSRIEGIAALKEASGNIGSVARISALCGDRLGIYSGNDDLITPTLALGGLGVFSVLSNLLPVQVGQICKLYFSGDASAATRLQLSLIPCVDAIFSEVNPIPIKALLAEVGLCREEYRLPLCPLSEEKRKEIIGLFTSLGYLT